MKLTQLEPQFLQRITDTTWKHVDTIGEANGIMFVCPKCLEDRGSRPGVHSIICWDPSVPQTTSPTPGRWNLVGTSFADLSLVAGSSSVLLTSPDGCGAHFFIRNGEIVNA